MKTKFMSEADVALTQFEADYQKQLRREEWERRNKYKGKGKQKRGQVQMLKNEEEEYQTSTR